MQSEPGSNGKVKLVLLQDGSTLGRELQGDLAGAGFGVVPVPSADLAVAALSEQVVQIVIICMSAADQRELGGLRHLRDIGVRAPLMAVIGARGEGQRAAALDAGADDCVDASFPKNELITRLRALLRRHAWDTTLSIFNGRFVLDRSTKSAVWSDERGRFEVSFTGLEFEFLYLLAEHSPNAVSHALIDQRLWHRDMRGSEEVRRKIKGRVNARLAAAMASVRIMSDHGIGYGIVAWSDSQERSGNLVDRTVHPQTHRLKPD